jgi:hypothetical protein
MIQLAKLSMRRGLAVALIVGAGLALSGCAFTMGELAQAKRPAAKPVMLTEAVLDDGAASAKPVALLEEDVPAHKERTPAAVAAETVVPPTSYPNINAVLPPHKSKLLTPEQKARVIADLESLARKQGAAMEKAGAPESAACKDLNAEELRKRMLDGRC